MKRDADRGEASHKAALDALLPTGPIWPREPDSDLGKIVAGLSTALARVRSRARALLVDAFPARTYELLPEWEATLGLPDPCAGERPTAELRRAQVVSRFISRGGQSVAYFEAKAAALGYAATVKEYRPSRAGAMRCGDRAQSAEWAHAWAIRSPQTTVRYFRSGRSAVGEPLRTWGNAVLECELRAFKPAHSLLSFQYV